MATCKKCGKNIPDGFEYCSSCSSTNKADESYLDSLLSSVSNAPAENSLKQQKTVRSSAKPVMPKFLAPNAAKLEADKFEKEVEKEIENDENSGADKSNYDILDIANEDFLDDLFEKTKESEESELSYESEILKDADDFEIDLSDDAAFETGADENQAQEAAFSAGIADSASDAATDIAADSTSDFTAEVDINEPVSEEDFLNDLLQSVDENAAAEAEMYDEPAEDPLSALDEAFALEGEGAAKETSKDDIDFFGAEVNPEANNGTEKIENADNSENKDTTDNSENKETGENTEAAENTEITEDQSTGVEPELTFEEIPGMELLDITDKNGDEATDEKAADSDKKSEHGKATIVESEEGEGGDEDVLEFWNNMNGVENSSDGGPIDSGSNTSETSDEQDELAALLAGLPEVDDGGLDIPDRSESKEIEAPVQEEAKPKKKMSFWQRIFGNVKPDISEEEMEAKKQAALDQYDQDQSAAELKKQQKEEAKAAAKAEAEEKKKEKQAQQEEAKKRKEEEKKVAKDKKLAAKKALLEEIEAENEGRINKIGASIVFLVFAIILCVVSVGTSVYTYNVAIANAKKDFEKDRYEDAYNDIYGIDVKDDDRLLYDQIMTVQYVNTHLISYIKYSSLDMENEALDSLLKGLRRYEKYIAYAKELEVDEDLDHLKTQILKELLEEYDLDEKQAYEIINSATQDAYSKAVREVVQQKHETGV